ncbi:MAG: carboxypeptidase M32 [Bacilli bacterium]|jgi:carboxypeptidase Taq|nr:carboxypeptidase M32 [Bacilli bacterium]
MEKLITQYRDMQRKLNAFQYAMYVIHWDSATEAPKGCFEERSKQIGVLSEEEYKLSTSKEYLEAVDQLFAGKDQLDPLLRHEIIQAKKRNDKITKIPMDEFVQFQMLMAKSQEIWAQAKIKKDFSLFAPTLKEIIIFLRKYVQYLQTEQLQGYDILLDEYEPGMGQKEYDQFFGLLKEKLVPFVRKVLQISNKKVYPFVKEIYPKEQQKQVCEYIQKVLAYDLNHGLMKESEHPFTSGYGTSDVRFTVHYLEDDFSAALFSAIHELGHATYEQQANPALNGTGCMGGASMAMHESQSRLYENVIGRSYAFWETHFPTLKEMFKEQMADTTLDDFYHWINEVKASYVRTEADELTYPIHIMLRYDIEKELINGTLSVEDLEQVWNSKFEEYFGIAVDSIDHGVLQDIHWAGGMVGYFPTYALGSALSSQIYYHMCQELPVDEILKEPTTAKINKWLQEKIHWYASSLYPKEIIKNAFNEEFNPQYYIDYLIEKYSKHYKIK